MTGGPTLATSSGGPGESSQSKSRTSIARLATNRFAWIAAILVLAAAGFVLRSVATGDGGSLARLLPWLNRPTVTLYFPDMSGRLLVPVTREVAKKDETPGTALAELVAGPSDRSMLAASFPADTVFNGATISGSEITMDVTLPGPGLNTELAIGSVAHTLEAFQGISSVRLVSAGTTLASGVVPPAGEPEHAIYYTYGAYLTPVGTTAATARDVVASYLAGEGRSDGLEGLPADVRLLEYRYDQDRELVYLNFTYTDSVKSMALNDSNAMRRTLTGLIATVTAYPEVKAVILDFQGHAKLGLGQCASLLRTPQVRPAVLNEEAAIL